MKQSPLRIVVTGLAATYPFGGVFWDYIQYLLGFRELGHDVLYLEDTGRWCYDPVTMTFVETGAQNAAHLEQQLKRLSPDLKDSWFFRDATEQTFGRSEREALAFCRTADLFLNISASCWMREEYFAAGRTVFIDSDPMYTQASIPDYQSGTIDEAARSRVDLLREHDVFFTFGENLSAPDCLVPNDIFDWQPTRQPIVLDCFEPFSKPISKRQRLLTTVASWEPTETGPTVNGVKYTGKSAEFIRFLDLPRKSDLPLEIALSGDAPIEQLQQAGWRIRPGYDVSKDPWLYRDYLARSLGEWSVAKNAYVQSRSGWFSCRTACYLALGVPAIVQETAFAADIPKDAGVLAFETVDDALSCIEELIAHPEKHSRHAQEIARECFDSKKVLSALIERAGASAGVRCSGEMAS